MDAAKAIALGTLLGLFACQSSDDAEIAAPDGTDSAGFRLMELDYFTLAYGYLKWSQDTNVQITEEGGKYLKHDMPEVRYVADFSGAYVKAAIKPSEWDAYLCLDGRLANTRSPDSNALFSIRTFADEQGRDLEYWYIPKDRRERVCSQFRSVQELDGGFIISGELTGVGTLRIFYK